ncbi:MAG: Mu-like prophage FluMu protein gp37 [Caulobacter sp.]|nr:Mu-like prophage FluMu protein gp37 [Caulobacter sp.]
MIGEIENAMLARLQAASDSDALGYRFKKLASLPIDFDERLAEYVKDFPAAWSVFSGATLVESYSSGAAKVEGSFAIVVAATNLRNEAQARHGGAAGEIGSYQLVSDAAGLLLGQELGLDIEAVAFRAITTLYSGKMIGERRASVLALEMTVRFLISPAAGAGDLNDFTTFHADWDVPPLGGIDADPATPGVQLPDEGHADASDTVTLETAP